ncbi:DNA repair protein RecO [Leptolyngbya sp. AN02str]|uniref:DNA repair protein RecO n=1 Tax=Leptolyngbya sp. AN02str TaxID=3423363 RepID=UPI003D31C9C1
MPGTYKAIGMNLKSSPMGENDRLVTVLTREQGLVRAIAPGSRKYQSSLRGRSGLFVINQLLLVQGKSLDKIIQAETLESFPGLSQDLKKLTAAQYLAELALSQALSDQPQNELFDHLSGYFHRLEEQPSPQALSLLVEGTFQLLALAGVAPQVSRCCVTQQVVVPETTDPNWRIGFHSAIGGIVSLTSPPDHRQPQTADAEPLQANPGDRHPASEVTRDQSAQGPLFSTAIAPRDSGYVRSGAASYRPRRGKGPSSATLETTLTAVELMLLQWLEHTTHASGSNQEATSTPASITPTFAKGVWLSIERVLRYHAQHHLERSIQSAALIDACFAVP